MQALGADAASVLHVLGPVEAAASAGRASFLWCDGESVTVVVADPGDRAEDVLRVAGRMCPEAFA